MTLPTVQQISSDLLPMVQQQGLAALLPDHIKPEAFIRSAAVAMLNNPAVVGADKQSIVNSLILAAKDGLLCDGREAALVPFKTKVNGQYVDKAQYMPMVDGVLKRIRQSGQVSMIVAKPVFKKDEFDYWFDEDGEHFKHKPCMDSDPGELICVLAAARLVSGELIVDVVPRRDVDRARAASKQGNNEYGPWVKYFDRMAVKTGLHRIGKRLPNSSEILEMLERGDQKEWQNEEKDITPQRERKSTAAMLNDAFSGNGNISQDQLNGDDSQQFNDSEDFSGGPSAFDKLEIEISEQSDVAGWNKVKAKLVNAMMGELIDEDEAAKLRIALNLKKEEIASVVAGN
ncbi:putative RecT Recombinational DNA repair protein (RecEpathway) [Vibrio phage 236O40-1]|nr:putative RecT Recombinational DNA repair protein (RecEpathway) [Vibrio phage 236O40-1]